MIITLLMVCGILFFALQLEEKLRVPSPLGLIVLSFITHYAFKNSPHLTLNADSFSTLVIFLLPILLISDSLELKVSDLKKNGLSLLFLTVIAVILSLGAALLISDWLFSSYALSSAAVIVLFTMVLATDPVSVVSIFSKFELPHHLKVLAEGESLLNDATALIVFVFIGLVALNGGNLTHSYIAEVSIEVVLGSITVGILSGFIGLIAMKSTDHRIAEMMVLIIVGYGAFEIAEHFYQVLNLFGNHSHFHLSGILSCIFATITVNHVMTKTLQVEKNSLAKDEAVLEREAASNSASSGLIKSTFNKIKVTIEEKDRHLRTKEDVQLLAVVANTILFVAMAEIINLQLLWQYKFEIMVMFIATTLIRAIMMGLFAWLANRTAKMADINFRWWAVLTFAGIKGGLSIVMLTMIPPTFEYLEMFKAVVIGVIMLSTFIYSAILILIISFNQASFHAETVATE